MTEIVISYVRDGKPFRKIEDESDRANREFWDARDAFLSEANAFLES